MPSEPESSRSILSTSDLHVHYGMVHAVQGVSIEICAGEVVALLGVTPVPGLAWPTFLKAAASLVISLFEKTSSWGGMLYGIER